MGSNRLPTYKVQKTPTVVGLSDLLTRLTNDGVVNHGNVENDVNVNVNVN